MPDRGVLVFCNGDFVSPWVFFLIGDFVSPWVFVLAASMPLILCLGSALLKSAVFGVYSMCVVYGCVGVACTVTYRGRVCCGVWGLFLLSVTAIVVARSFAVKQVPPN